MVQISQKSRHEYWATHLFARSLAPLTHLLALHCLLHLRAPLRLFVCSLAYTQAHGKVEFDVSAQNQTVLNHSDMVRGEL